MSVGGPGDPGAAATSAPPSLRGAYVGHQLRALTGGRLGGRRTLVAFVGGFLAVIGIGVAVVAIVAPTTKPLCQPYKPCGPPRYVKPLVAETLWRSSQFGYTLEFPGNDFAIAQQFPDGLTLSGKDPSSGNSIVILIRAAAAGQVGPSRAVTNLLSNINGVTQLATDPDPANAILGGGIGHRLGAGGAYVGSETSPQGVSSDASLAAESATDGRVTVAMVAVGATGDTGPTSLLYQDADSIVNSVQWPAGP